MKFIDVTITNYGSFAGSHTVSLADRGLCLIMGINHDEPKMQSNGSGKSTMPDAIDWCLFGVVPRKDKADSVINEKAGKGCQVITRLLNDEGQEIRVQRSRKVSGEKSRVRFWVDDEEKSTLDANETQRRLETLLGMDRQVFHSTCLFAQFDDWRFADATNAERTALLTKIIPELGIVDKWLERTKELHAESLERTKSLEVELETVVARGQALQGADPTPLAQQWDTDQQERNHDLWVRMNAHADGLRALHDELQTLPEEAPPPAPQPPPVVNVQPFKTENMSATLRLAHARQQTVQAKQHLDAVLSGGSCNACGQQLPQATQDQQDAAQSAYENCLKWEQESEGYLAQTQEALSGVEAQVQHNQQIYQQALATHSADNQASFARQHRRQRLIDRINEVQGELTQMEHQLNNLKFTNPYAAKITAHQEQLRACLEQHTVAAAQHQMSVAETECLDFWRAAFGPKGIKSHILDSRIQEMTTEANRWVHFLTGGTFWVRFETQAEVGTGKNKRLVDEFTIRVFRHNPDGTQSERGYRSGSGGEQSRIGRGIDFGLARLVANRASANYDLLFLDEIFGKHLDAAGKEAMAEMLTMLSKEKSSIFVIDHDPRFQSQFTETIVVEKRNGESTITTEKKT